MLTPETLKIADGGPPPEAPKDEKPKTLEERMAALESTTKALMQDMLREYMLHLSQIDEAKKQFTRDTAHLAALQMHVNAVHTKLEDHAARIQVHEAIVGAHSEWLDKQPGTVMSPAAN